MLAYNEIALRKLILVDGHPYEVLASHIFRMQMRKPVNKTKLRNLKTGSVIEKTFHQNEAAEEAEIDSKTAKFIYERNGEFWFAPPDKPSERFTIPEEIVGEAGRFLKTSSEVSVLWFDEEPIQVRVPIKMTLKVTDAPPAVRGNTVQGGTKQVTLETGATVQTPLFVNAGDSIIVNTDTGQYVERG